MNCLNFEIEKLKDSVFLLTVQNRTMAKITVLGKFQIFYFFNHLLEI